MFSLSALVLTALVCLIIGALIGYAVLANMGSAGSGNRTLETRLQAAEQQLADYQTQVAQHFQRTAELVNNLTTSYREVHEHLANGASNLANPEISQHFLSETGKPLPGQPAPNSDLVADDAKVEPPRDWSPEKGTLSESFGLDGKPEEDPTTQVINR